ncbi:hypothetical protein E2F43_11995 [Seongchinamella unica]|uniref:Uncharacterized protein n=1 Tax=Seongchinamella unica TaxID=2547392 RepID=A0A4R5LTB0_9GAMM|nr:hypothetical protein [Seongchinamella unica]TDG14188.1 hypothetical protein E2F43_11995 [Seongchinamella unica]
MTEYEIVDVINNATSNMIAAQALFITVVSAYVVVAYTVGKDLTLYQVSFVNFGLLLFVFISVQSALGLTGIISLHIDKLIEYRGIGESEAASMAVMKVFLVGVRAILIIGAFIFMWQVRHPKTE